MSSFRHHHLLSMLAVVAVGAPLSAQARADQQAQAAPAANAGCPAMPYSVGMQTAGIEAMAQLGSTALTNAATKIPNIQARGGVEIIKTMKAGMKNEAMASVLDNYVCVLKASLKASNVDDLQTKYKAIDSAVADLKLEMGTISGDAGSPTDLQTERAAIAAKTTRSATDPTLDPALVKAAFSKLMSPNDLFLSSVQLRYWGTVNWSTYITAGACGQVVHAAISDGGSSLQHGLADVENILINYLDPNAMPKVALSTIYNDLANNATTAQAAAASSVQGCTAQLAQSAAASTTAAGTGTSTTTGPVPDSVSVTATATTATTTPAGPTTPPAPPIAPAATTPPQPNPGP